MKEEFALLLTSCVVWIVILAFVVSIKEDTIKAKDEIIKKQEVQIKEYQRGIEFVADICERQSKKLVEMVK